MTEIKPCDCEHKYQDEKYGKGKRVHNSAKSKVLNVLAWVCTVCGKVKT